MNSQAKVQFAVVREDPNIEAELVEALDAQRVLLIGSGGCTAFSLKARFPELKCSLVDLNPAQLDLVRRKATRLESDISQHRDAFNLEDPSPDGLNQCGRFEGLFRGLRHFIEEFILPADSLREMFENEEQAQSIRTRLTRSPYWPVAFELFFSDALLHTMFGPEATQHAAPGSYPIYFRQVFERGLSREDALDNYFLHHILLGHYLDRPASLPLYLQAPAKTHDFDYFLGTVADVPDLDSYDLIQLSNIMDWMSADAIAELAGDLRRRMRPGAVVLCRQLNNRSDLSLALGSGFRVDGNPSADRVARDRSLFYNAIHVGERVE